MLDFKHNTGPSLLINIRSETPPGIEKMETQIDHNAYSALFSDSEESENGKQGPMWQFEYRTK